MVEYLQGHERLHTVNRQQAKAGSQRVRILRPPGEPQSMEKEQRRQSPEKQGLKEVWMENGV